VRFRDVISEFAAKQEHGLHGAAAYSAGVLSSAGDAGGGDKEMAATSSPVVDTAATATSTANSSH